MIFVKIERWGEDSRGWIDRCLDWLFGLNKCRECKTKIVRGWEYWDHLDGLPPVRHCPITKCPGCGIKTRAPMLAGET